MPTPDEVYNALANVVDPELNIPITDLGLVYDVQVNGSKADVKMTLTTMGCPLGASITELAQQEILKVIGIEEVNVELIWDLSMVCGHDVR